MFYIYVFFFIYALPYFLGTVYGVWFFHILYFKISSSVTLLMKAFTHCWQPYGFSPLQMLLQLLEKVKTLQLLENYKVSCPYNSINVYPNLSIMWKYFFLFLTYITVTFNSFMALKVNMLSEDFSILLTNIVIFSSVKTFMTLRRIMIYKD